MSGPARDMQKNVILAGPYALGFTADRQIAACTHLWREDVLIQTMAADSPGFSEHQVRWDGATISLVNLWSPNYFHWILENLAQLVSIPFRYIDRIAIPADSPAYIWDSLERLGLDHLAVEWSGRPTLCDTLLSFGPIRENGRTDPLALARLRTAFKVGNQLERSPVYISRAKATQRRVVNEAELVTLLERHGFTVVHAEDLSFVQQCQLFGWSGMLLGVHGAGLTNMVWAPRGCRILELAGEYRNPCYGYLAGALEHQYELVPCEQQKQDLIVDLADLERRLQ